MTLYFAAKTFILPFLLESHNAILEKILNSTAATASGQDS